MYMPSPLDLEAIEVIETIDRKGSFAAAAAVLNKVPSAVSYTVQKLETDLGVTLFQKEGRRAVFTTAGRHLVEQGRALLLAADELAAETRQIATGWEPRLRLAIDAVVPMDAVLPAIARLYDQQPGIEISLSREVLAGTWEALGEGRVDLVIGGVGDVPGHRGIRCEPWLRFSHVFVATPDHPLCQVPAPVSAQLIEQYRAVVIRDTSRNSTPLSRGLLSQRSVLYVPDMETKLNAHRQGLGVGYVPGDRVASDLRQQTLVALTLEEQRQDGPTMLGWRAGNRGQALQFLVAQLRDAGAID